MIFDCQSAVRRHLRGVQLPAPKRPERHLELMDDILCWMNRSASDARRTKLASLVLVLNHEMSRPSSEKDRARGKQSFEMLCRAMVLHHPSAVPSPNNPYSLMMCQNAQQQAETFNRRTTRKTVDSIIWVVLIDYHDSVETRFARVKKGHLNSFVFLMTSYYINGRIITSAHMVCVAWKGRAYCLWEESL